MIDEGEFIKELDRHNERIKALSKRLEQQNKELKAMNTTEDYIEFVRRWYGVELKGEE